MFCINSSLTLEIPTHMINCIHLFPLLFQQFSQPAVIEQLAYILIVIGGIMFFLSFLGYCGAIGESKCMLSLVSSFMCNAKRIFENFIVYRYTVGLGTAMKTEMTGLREMCNLLPVYLSRTLYIHKYVYKSKQFAILCTHNLNDYCWRRGR